MKLNYGLKVGDRVTLGGKGEVGIITEIYRPRQHGIGFCSAMVKWPTGGPWISALSDLKKEPTP